MSTHMIKQTSESIREKIKPKLSLKDYTQIPNAANTQESVNPNTSTPQNLDTEKREKTSVYFSKKVMKRFQRLYAHLLGENHKLLKQDLFEEALIDFLNKKEPKEWNS